MAVCPCLLPSTGGWQAYVLTLSLSRTQTVWLKKKTSSSILVIVLYFTVWMILFTGLKYSADIRQPSRHQALLLHIESRRASGPLHNKEMVDCLNWKHNYHQLRDSASKSAEGACVMRANTTCSLVLTVFEASGLSYGIGSGTITRMRVCVCI